MRRDGLFIATASAAVGAFLLAAWEAWQRHDIEEQVLPKMMEELDAQNRKTIKDLTRYNRDLNKQLDETLVQLQNQQTVARTREQAFIKEYNLRKNDLLEANTLINEQLIPTIETLEENVRGLESQLQNARLRESELRARIQQLTATCQHNESEMLKLMKTTHALERIQSKLFTSIVPKRGQSDAKHQEELASLREELRTTQETLAEKEEALRALETEQVRLADQIGQYMFMFRKHNNQRLPESDVPPMALQAHVPLARRLEELRRYMQDLWLDRRAIEEELLRTREGEDARFPHIKKKKIIDESIDTGQPPLPALTRSAPPPRPRPASPSVNAMARNWVAAISSNHRPLKAIDSSPWFDSDQER